MKKIITAVLAVTMAVGMLTGCGSGSGTGKKEASGEKLVIWTNMNVEVDTIQKYADEWGEKNGRKVEVIHQSPSVQQFAQAVKSASGPDAVVGIPNDQLADYVNADLTAEVPQDLYADQDFFRCSHPGMLCRWKAICSTTFRRDYCTVLQHRSCIGSPKNMGRTGRSGSRRRRCTV